MKRLRGRIGGHLSVATRLEGKAFVLERAGDRERAQELRAEAAEHRKKADKLRAQYYGGDD